MAHFFKKRGYKKPRVVVEPLIKRSDENKRDLWFVSSDWPFFIFCQLYKKDKNKEDRGIEGSNKIDGLLFLTITGMLHPL